ncbi:Tim44 domain-containing protein [Haematospirillum jordaniae]|uniref:Tim44-like domain-containing protein n=1 Tax=Haematospirillum jordaniae TaxID=1549855 RepID=A0A143DCW5_9PROT|nr:MULTISPECIES: Tim44/TimA family putative adaptor protein [Haematospirillum]AMW34439.1 hypothetical protein AY555_03710 [Haematospirillum jordaniae]NKD44577.1 Tim44 domain-containing protein [Haematospirillum jordaniae]NKD55573.1 Tim44 domain-containing protein [Haematospirillum sp. H4890]NKD57597.1 Tim44 domain-containing protein [Haematospirillum jordaniae]NKD59167.1 Tim44 domain-containing protein [Haematospirillum jordaniae]
MNQGIAFIDIIFLALVAGFLILRLRSVLGQKNGNERPRDLHGRTLDQDTGDNVIPLPGRYDSDISDESLSVPGLVDVMKADPSFVPEEFLGGARRAFEMVIEAFARGDRETLRFLLAEDVYRSFEGEIQTRESKNLFLETGLEFIRSISFIKAELAKDVVLVSVRFVSEQISVTRDSEGRIVEGDPNETVVITDDWTFMRDPRSDDPNWKLVSTAAPSA